MAPLTAQLQELSTQGDDATNTFGTHRQPFHPTLPERPPVHGPTTEVHTGSAQTLFPPPSSLAQTKFWWNRYKKKKKMQIGQVGEETVGKQQVK